MKKELSRTEAENKIKFFFEEIKSKTSKEIKKIKKLAQSRNLKLKERKKYFCNKCLVPFSGKEKIRVKNKVKTITCLSCNAVSRWKIK